MKRLLRNTLFYLHLVSGVLAGLVILTMSVTGAALAFEQQILASINRSYGHEPAVGETPLPMGQLLEKARGLAFRPGAQVGNVTVYADPGRPAMVSFGREGTVYVDSYTGTGGPAKGVAFFRLMTDWHRWLAMSGEGAAGRATGKAITGASNLAFLLIVLSGLVLWFPNSWRWAAVKLHLVPSVKLRGKARDWNWHNALGFWAFLPLVLIVTGGVVISYPWATDLVYRAAGERPPPRAGAQAVPPASRPADATRPATTATSQSAVMLSLEQAYETARGYSPGWRSLSFTPPRDPRALITFTLDRGTGRQPQHKATLTVNPVTGERRFETASAQSPGRKLRSFFRFGHTGEYFGIPGQFVGLLACLAACVLVFTGLALAARRGVNVLRGSRVPTGSTTAAAGSGQP